jgi:hypothetical protein
MTSSKVLAKREELADDTIQLVRPRPHVANVQHEVLALHVALVPHPPHERIREVVVLPGESTVTRG